VIVSIKVVIRQARGRPVRLTPAPLLPTPRSLVCAQFHPVVGRTPPARACFLNRSNVFNDGRGLLFFDFVSNVFRRLPDRRFAAMRHSRRRPLRRLICRPVFGGCSEAEEILRAPTVAVNGQENVAAPDSARVTPGDVFGQAQARQQPHDPTQRPACVGVPLVSRNPLSLDSQTIGPRCLLPDTPLCAKRR